MRLQCPNCDAEYEVDASAIPYEGRDVQCSNCGHGWFQAHPDFEADYEVESALYDPPPPLAQGAGVAGEIPKRELPPEAMQILREEVALEEARRAAEAKAADRAVRGPAPAAPADDGFEAELDAMARGDAPAAPAAKDDFADIEAALDAGAQAQAEVPTDPAQDFTAPLPRVAPRRVARLKGIEEDPPAPVSPPPTVAPAAATSAEEWHEAEFVAGASEADLLGKAKPAKPRQPRKSGGRLGFYTVILSAFAAVAAYVLGPEISAAVPALAAPLERYATEVNALRDQVDVIVPQAMDMAKGLMNSALAWVSAQGWF